MNSPTASPQPSRLSGVVAVVGCDGSGKSTLTADLLARLSAVGPARFVYLGQSSGNVLRGIRKVPLVGAVVGAFLKRRSERAHADDGAPAAPDFMTALVVYGLSRWRYAKFRRVVALSRSGIVVVTDRYPQSEVSGFYFDGPGLSADLPGGRATKWLAARERRLYQRMSSHLPALVIRLDIDAETARARKPDHKLSMLQDKVRVIPTLRFNGAPLLGIDAGRPYEAVLRCAEAAALSAVSEGPASA